MTKANCIKFYQLIIEKDGKPTTKDFQEAGLPFEMFLRLATGNLSMLSNEKLVMAAKKCLYQLKNIGE